MITYNIFSLLCLYINLGLTKRETKGEEEGMMEMKRKGDGKKRNVR